MQITSKFTIAVHIITAIDYFKDSEKVTSSFLAGSVGANPVIVRNVMGKLKESGIIEISQGKRGISADTALRLAAFFQTDAQSWLNLQNHYDTEQAREKIVATLAHIPAYNAAILNS
mgnify:CR=1 FL=1